MVMKKSQLLTTNGSYWYFHAIGTGVIFTYHKHSRQIIILCSASGTIINTVDRDNCPFIEPQEFLDEAKSVYLDMIEGADTSLELSFYDNPTFLAGGLIEVDLELIKN